MRRSAGITAVVLVATVASWSAGDLRAQDEKPKKAFGLTLEKDKPIRFRQFMRTDQAFELSLFSAVTQTVIARDYTLTPVGAAENGGTRATWRFDRIWGFMDTPLASAEFDSATPPAEGMDMMTAALTCLGGAEFVVTFGPQGDVRSVEGVAAAKKAVVDRQKDDKEMWDAILSKLITVEKVRSEIDFALLLTQLPNSADAGTSWTDTDTIPGTSGFLFTLKTARKIDAAAEGVLTVGGDVVASVATAPGRQSAVAELITKAGPDAFSATTAGTVSAEDGLPIEHDTAFWVSVEKEQDDETTLSVEQVSRFVTRRITAEAAPTVAQLHELPLYGAHVEEGGPKEVAWLRLCARVHADGEDPDEARRVYGKARAMAAKGAEAHPNVERWSAEYVLATKGLAFLEGGVEDWGAAAAAWTNLVSTTTKLRKAEHGTRWFTWEEAHGRVMLANTKNSAGQGAVALALYGAADRFIAGARKADPEHAGLTGLHGWGFERWSDALLASDKPKDALAKGEAAIAIGDAAGGRSAQQTSDLVNRLWELGDMALAAGDAKRAAELLDRGQKELGPLIEHNPELATYRDDITARRDVAKLIATGAKPADAQQAVTMAYVLTTMKRYAESTAQFEVALADEAVRADWESHNLYNGACSAAKAHAGASGEDKARFAKLAIEWLTPHVARLSGILAGTDDEAKQGAAGYMNWTREGDPDLASLRDLAEFKALFKQ